MLLFEIRDEEFPKASENVDLLVSDGSGKVESDVVKRGMLFRTGHDELLKEGEVRRVWSSEMEQAEFGKKKEELSKVVTC